MIFSQTVISNLFVSSKYNNELLQWISSVSTAWNQLLPHTCGYALVKLQAVQITGLMSHSLFVVASILNPL